MAKGLVKSRRTRERMLLTKTHINSTILELKNNVGTTASLDSKADANMKFDPSPF
jgi:hypothetical protein